MARNPLSRAVDAATRGPESLVRTIALLPRVERLLTIAESVATRAEQLITGLERRERDLGIVIADLDATQRAAQRVVDRAGAVVGLVADAAGRYEPVVDHAVDTLAYANSRVGRDQVDAVASYLEFAPLLEALDRDVVPTMKTLQSVAPDLTELLAVSKALNEMMGSLPGLGRAKKRVDEELAQQ